MDDIARFDLQVQLRIMAVKMAAEFFEDYDDEDLVNMANRIYRFMNEGKTEDE